MLVHALGALPINAQGASPGCTKVHMCEYVLPQGSPSSQDADMPGYGSVRTDTVSLYRKGSANTNIAEHINVPDV